MAARAKTAPPPVEQTYSPDEVAEITRLSRSTIYKMFGNELPYVVIRGRRRVRASDLRRLLDGEPAGVK